MINTNRLSSQVIVAPNYEFEPRKHNLFLAGGITDCPDWQNYMADKLTEVNDLNVFNPRRPDFPINNPEATDEQIEWEYKYLKAANAISVWFSNATLNPIVLYELGIWVNARPEIPAFVGIEPGYARTRDVITQTKLARPEIEIVDTVDALCGQVKRYLLSN